MAVKKLLIGGHLCPAASKHASKHAKGFVDAHTIDLHGADERSNGGIAGKAVKDHVHCFGVGVYLHVDLFIYRAFIVFGILCIHVECGAIVVLDGGNCIIKVLINVLLE